MAGIGDDIRDVLQELGTPFVIHKLDGTTISGEYLDYEFYADQSTEFIRQFCYSGDFQFDSKVQNGDLIFFDGKYFLILNIRKTIFEEEAVDYSNFFIECNTMGKLCSLSTTRGTDYKNTPTWGVIHNHVAAVQADRATEELTEKVMNIAMNKYVLYCQGYSDVKVGDRWYPDLTNDNEYYKIVSLNRRRFKGVIVCNIEEEAR